VEPPLAPIVQQQASTSGAITTRFLGTTSILFQDGETTILSDGFVTRPERRDVFVGKIGPDAQQIQRTLTRLGVDRIAAIFTGHSHYDHALDAPLIAKQTEAVLVGSESTRNVGLGGTLPNDRIHVVRHGDTCRFGKFALTFLESKHSSPEPWRGEIRAPFATPARARMWKTGKTWSVLIRHEMRTLLVHGSANYKPGALRDHRADVIYLGIGGLGFKSTRFVRDYWNEVVRSTCARRVILVHWDDFFGTDEPLRPEPSFNRAAEHIRRLASMDGVEVLLPVLWDMTDPFEGLERPTR
jgi:L-ascorbate metabolism protein UlaG (beta-lactamase superfamily)